jgi:2-desacetyl-2-hydroxyethyl bacteriochlorophyllide A dehydrogenase
MQAVVIDKPGDVGVGEVPDPSPGPGEVVVAVRACGICGTDIHIVDGEYSPTRYPVIPGHEFAGEVVALGKEVTGISIGAMVTADPNNPCGHCRPCREGHGNLCENPRGCGVSVAGACADYVVVPAWKARELPVDFDVSVGALVEPLSCAVHGYDLIRTSLGGRFLIYGAGTMGLMLVALAGRVGAISVSVIEPNAARRDLAYSLGATRVFADSQLLDGESFDLVIDATGVIGAIEDGLTRLKRGGTYLQFGVAPAEAPASFSPYRLYSDELTFVGSMAVLHSFDRACDIAVNVDIGLSKLVSDTLPLASYVEALDRVRHGQGLKVQVAPGTTESR